MTDYDHRYIIGMDLGTTNSAVAYVDLADEDASRRRIRRFDVPQLVGLGEVAARMVLPSFLYLPGAHDLPQGGAALPWDDERAYVVGEFAREQGARVPGRLVSSAKSWLSHAGVTGIDGPPGLRLQMSSAVMTAAIQGVGVALARSCIAEPYLLNGALVRPLRAEYPRRFAYYLVCNPIALSRGAVAQVHAWLLEQGSMVLQQQSG